ncbi:hypothetical protein AWC05_03140 [Mycobacterium florentinum]|uniref:DUF5642 domain-containing protein n=1 Tax=Mycobacterium florentinum TaxID=292462 RepID=A0A1X1TXA3_MYCFL|nr:hypothetical protein [Mycobacterium florentinum]MCV7413409.1 hypothetical protein [Mycobacterium florentinum]ORV49167.1 hypothetical protein AWC05_03140 [Mycobacterium florentinum]BBX76942.1 hypothetical protein MFLOJ_07290 [Mycobacterium florentinum]
MRLSRPVITGVAAATALALTLAGCGGNPKPSPTTSGSATSSSSKSSAAPTSSTPAAPAADYTGWLIQVTDIDAPVPFTGTPPTANPDGQPGATITFNTQDNSHTIKSTIQVLADPGAATSALNAAKSAQGGAIKHPTTDAVKIGTDGAVVSGNSPDNSKGIAVLLFTEGKAFVTIEFDGPPDTLPPPDFINDIGQKQDAAVKKGLGG